MPLVLAASAASALGAIGISATIAASIKAVCPPLAVYQYHGHVSVTTYLIMKRETAHFELNLRSSSFTFVTRNCTI